MPRKKTHGEYVQQVKQKAPHIQVLEQYVANRTPIKHYCLKHKIEWTVSPFNFLQHPSGCPQCQKETMDKYYCTKRKTNEQFLQELNALKTGIIPLDDYNGYNEKMLFQCQHGHIWQSTPHSVLDGYGCPYCAGNRTLQGFNDLWTTHPDIAKMLFDENVGYTIGKGSNIEVEWICPRCGTHKMASPKQVVTYGLACSVCSDGTSYPNKFIRNLLMQLNLNFIPELTKKHSGFEWVDNYRYDVYFEYNDQAYIIEMDGGIGHGCIEFNTGACDVDGLNRDIIKEKKAKEHNIVLIRIDCDYKLMRKRLDYIKQSILQSELSKILDLTNIDWDKCNAYATKSLHMDAVRQYEDGCSIREISQNLHVSYHSVYSWLKRLGKEGLCSYTPVVGRKKNINIKTHG